MNYLFVMPRFRQNKEDTYMFPLGIAYVSASLKGVRKNIYCLNLNVNMGEIEEELKKEIEKHQIDVIATGGLTPNFKQIRTIITAAKKIKPGILKIAAQSYELSPLEKNSFPLVLNLVQSTICELHCMLQKGHMVMFAV